MRLLPIFILIGMLVCPNVWAAASQILKIGKDGRSIAITRPGRKWRVEDQACVFQSGKQVICGQVIKSSDRGAIVRLDSKTDSVATGDEVRNRTGAKRQPAAALMNSYADPDAKVYRFDFTAGFNIGFNYFFPTVNFQVAIAKGFSLGLVPLYFKASQDSASLTSFGGYLTVNYYASDTFRGLWVQTGPGMFLFNTTDNVALTSEKANSPAFMATLGWRGYWDLGVNIGIAGGLQYIKSPNFTTADIKSTGVQPLFILDAGFNF